MDWLVSVKEFLRFVWWSLFLLLRMFFSFINLGCTKNLVDTQFLLGRILERRPDQFFLCC